MAGSVFRDLVVGVDNEIALPGGGAAVSINLDNAATTPPFVDALNEIINFAPMYSSVNRGAGYKSQLSTEWYERSRKAVADFVKADLEHDVVIYVKNTTEAINKLSYRLYDGKKGVILSTGMEHHSNDLPWRKYHLDYVETDNHGRLDLGDLVKKLKKYGRSVKLVTVTGASNVTGYVNPVHEIAETAHRFNAKILVDGAQLVPHAELDMKPFNSPRHIDYLAFSGHKMYAPFGAGVLIGPEATFKKGIPEYAGGGTVKTVTRKKVIWDDPPNKDEAGTPNVMGVLGLQAAIQTLSRIRMRNIADYELELWKYAVERLRDIPGLTLHCDTHPGKPRIGIIPFNLDGIHHALVADILSREAGIAVRSGCFCAQPYVRRLLSVTPGETVIRRRNYRSSGPGMVRVSFGLYNDRNEINVLIQTLRRVAEHREYYTQKYGTR
ncbi:MAG: aminotransferase class V-fold PLP-dependent enzyme [Bacillota bacterium]